MSGGGAWVRPCGSTRCDPNSRREPFDDPEMRPHFKGNVGRGPVAGGLSETGRPGGGLGDGLKNKPIREIFSRGTYQSPGFAYRII